MPPVRLRLRPPGEGLVRFAEISRIPVARFGKNDRKIEVMRPYLGRQAGTGRAGVAAIGIAQEFAPVFTATKEQRGKTVTASDGKSVIFIAVGLEIAALTRLFCRASCQD